MAAETPTTNWWGSGGPPTERWPGVTIPIDDCEGRYRFDAAIADRVCAFFPRYCSHSKGEFAGKPFEPLDYQTQLILRPIFGWVRASDGVRRFQKAYIEIPKKNGKTQLIAGLALYMLLCDNEPGAEVYVAAADREQARILFNAAKAMIEAHPALKQRCIVYRNQITRADDPTAFFQVLSAEAATKHGPNIHCLIIDELHAQPDRELYETLTRGIVARRQPLILEITTAGDDDESICYEEYDYAKRVLSGAIIDERHLPVIFEARPDDDCFAQDTWYRINPGLGTTVKLDQLASAAREAANEPRKRNDFLRFHTNRWVNQATAWIPIERWDACDEPLPDDSVLATMQGAVGIDMSQKIDLTCAAAVFRIPLQEHEDELPVETVAEDDADPENPRPALVTRSYSLNFKLAILPAFWLPEETLSERVKQDRMPYHIWRETKWREQPLLRVTPGHIIDTNAVVDYIAGRQRSRSARPDVRGADLVTRFPILKELWKDSSGREHNGRFGYDPAFARDVAVGLEQRGLTTVEVLQNYTQLCEACQIFEALVKAGRVLHGGHRLLRQHVENVAVKRDDAGRIRPVKPRSQTKRIDGVVATLIGLSQLIKMPVTARRRGGRAAKMWTPGGWKEIGDAPQPTA